MKKLKLKAFDLEGSEILTREQLKKVLGGASLFTTEPPTDTTNCICTCEDGSTAGIQPGEGAGKACESYCEDHGGGGSVEC